MDTGSIKIMGKDLLLSRAFWGLILTALGPEVGAALARMGLDHALTVDIAVTLSGLALGLFGILRRKTKIISVAGLSLPKCINGHDTRKAHR